MVTGANFQHHHKSCRSPLRFWSVLYVNMQVTCVIYEINCVGDMGRSIVKETWDVELFNRALLLIELYYYGVILTYQSEYDRIIQKASIE